MNTIQLLDHQLYKLIACFPPLASVRAYIPTPAAQTTVRGRSRAMRRALRCLSVTFGE